MVRSVGDRRRPGRPSCGSGSAVIGHIGPRSLGARLLPLASGSREEKKGARKSSSRYKRQTELAAPEFWPLIVLLLANFTVHVQSPCRIAAVSVQTTSPFCLFHCFFHLASRSVPRVYFANWPYWPVRFRLFRQSSFSGSL